MGMIEFALLGIGIVAVLCVGSIACLRHYGSIVDAVSKGEESDKKDT